MNNFNFSSLSTIRPSALHQVDVGSFYSRCINGFCKASNEAEGKIDEEKLEEVLCEILSEYSLECTRQNVFFNWRSQSLCREWAPWLLNAIQKTLFEK